LTILSEFFLYSRGGVYVMAPGETLPISDHNFVFMILMSPFHPGSL